MQRAVLYNTKQGEAILAYISSLAGAHVTAAAVAEHFRAAGSHVGRSTVYRHLNRLTAEGKLRKYIAGGGGACFQLSNSAVKCAEHFHLKCESCEALLHLECSKLNALGRHILEHHAFSVDAGKTVFYGKCQSCRKTGEARV
jgi:Fur family ferric uptake transcriptional regulator